MAAILVVVPGLPHEAGNLLRRSLPVALSLSRSDTGWGSWWRLRIGNRLYSDPSLLGIAILLGWTVLDWLRSRTPAR